MNLCRLSLLFYCSLVVISNTTYFCLEKVGLVSISDHFNPKSLYIPRGTRVNIYASFIIVTSSPSFASSHEIGKS